MTDPMRSSLTDERGKPSTSRRLLWITLLWTLALTTADAVLARVTVPEPAWGLLSAVLIALIAWAGGPRALENLGNQVGKVAEAFRRGKP